MSGAAELPCRPRRPRQHCPSACIERAPTPATCTRRHHATFSSTPAASPGPPESAPKRARRALPTPHLALGAHTHIHPYAPPPHTHHTRHTRHTRHIHLHTPAKHRGCQGCISWDAETLSRALKHYNKDAPVATLDCADFSQVEGISAHEFFQG
jgi:hypothetical protein